MHLELLRVWGETGSDRTIALAFSGDSRTLAVGHVDRGQHAAGRERRNGEVRTRCRDCRTSWSTSVKDSMAQTGRCPTSASSSCLKSSVMVCWPQLVW